MSDLANKIIILGKSNVGKTKLVQRFKTDTFIPDNEATIGASFFTHDMIIDNKKVQLSLWDTSGQERYFSILPLYIRNSKVALVCTDDYNDIKSLEMYINKIKSVISEDMPKIFIVITKIDLFTDTQRRRYQKIIDYAEYNGYKLYFTSAKTGEGITQLFEDIGKYLLHFKEINTYSTNLISDYTILPKERCSGCHIL